VITEGEKRKSSEEKQESLADPDVPGAERCLQRTEGYGCNVHDGQAPFRAPAAKADLEKCRKEASFLNA
jgi:hypothetical protein